MVPAIQNVKAIYNLVLCSQIKCSDPFFLFPEDLEFSLRGGGRMNKSAGSLSIEIATYFKIQHGI